MWKVVESYYYISVHNNIVFIKLVDKHLLYPNMLENGISGTDIKSFMKVILIWTLNIPFLKSGSLKTIDY